MSTLYSSSVGIISDKLDDALAWLAKVRADVDPGQSTRLDWIEDDIRSARRIILSAAVTNVEVEQCRQPSVLLAAAEWRR